jgi:hypothetical protein
MKARAKRIFPNDPEAYKLAEHVPFCNRLCCQEHRREYSGPTMRELRFITADGPRAGANGDHEYHRNDGNG